MRRLLILALAALALSACGSAATTTPAAPAAAPSAIQVSDAWARVVPVMADTQPTGAAMGEAKPTGAAMGSAASGPNGAAYLTIRNSGPADRLLKAMSDAAGTVELHTVIDDNGVKQMRPVEAIDVPANGEVALKPGSFHVMMFGVKQDLKPGDTINLTLQFEKAGSMTVKAEVRQQ
ncbi:MAG: copper chaperone PCu(A)C [Kouleothrix sp.]|nr:copper chaperone PCu(A)C [Kouleothrix sp.]